ncbi:MAG: 50S ribosomal protein L9 [Lewinellaceae bacterium]|nr:50S ribosomal protein L9 [Lewinellaceae bacterium]
MDVILLQHIDKVGDKHDVVKVKDGYGRNFLIPQGMAIIANKSNLARLDGMKMQNAKKESAKVDIYKGYAAKIAGASLKLSAKAGESGRLFGSVTVQHLLDAIKALDVEIEKRHIQMPEEVKELGSYTATITYHPEVSVEANFEVVAADN